MMGMIEKVARAICSVEYGDENHGWENQIPAARAAIEAMRDPTKEMVIAGNEAAREKIDLEYYESSGGFIEMDPDLAVYTLDAMIDVALSEPGKLDGELMRAGGE
jgi:hypothetical protein